MNLIQKGGLLLCFVGLLATTACGNSSNQKPKKPLVESIKQGDWDALVDSGKEYGRLTKVVAQHLTVQDKRVKFDLSKREFKQTGLDVAYYKQVNEAVKEFNAMLDSEAMGKAEASVKEFMQFLSKKLKEWSE